MITPPSQDTVAVCNQITFLNLYYIISRLVTLLKVINAPIQVSDVLAVIIIIIILCCLLNVLPVPSENFVLQCLAKKCSGNAHTVAEYGVLWRHLSKQTQDLGNAMGYTYGGQVVLYFTLQLVGTFGFISQVQQAKPLTTVGFLSTALIFSWHTYVFCNAADRATKLVRNNRVLFFSFCARKLCCGGQIFRSFREAEVTIQQLGCIII